MEGMARITVITNRGQSGKAAIGKTVLRTMSGVAHIWPPLHQTTQTTSGKANILGYTPYYYVVKSKSEGKSYVVKTKVYVQGA
jgi:hypothetical protein